MEVQYRHPKAKQIGRIPIIHKTHSERRNACILVMRENHMPHTWYIVCVCSVAQSCQTLCNHMDYSPPDSSVHAIFSGKNTGAGGHLLLQGSSWHKDRSLISCFLHWQVESPPLAALGEPITSLVFGKYSEWFVRFFILN